MNQTRSTMDARRVSVGAHGARAWERLFFAALLCALISLYGRTEALAQSAEKTDAQQDLEHLTLSTDAVAPLRFIAVHGERAVMMGYPLQGLEMWAYPVQVCSGYGIDIRPEGAARATPGELLLRRIEVRPQETTRIYVGANFVVREQIFVPFDQPGAIVTYTVEGRQPVEITVHFTPVLDLMWPASVGGQSVQWREAGRIGADAKLAGYLLEEPLHRFSAFLASPNVIAHDSTENGAVRSQPGMAFTLRPAEMATGERVATVFVGLDRQDPPGSPAPPVGTEVSELVAKQTAFESQAANHYAALTQRALRIETPDESLNQALAWAAIALDQSWVCDPGVGCGLVAGYGPSRGGRRPQYDWFFAGDGMIAGDGLLAVGERERAREELEFILKYQDAKSGMIWHELSQSASYLDWVGKYPYMYVHVDITFQFLGAVGRYVAATGDADFVRRHWAALEAAYRYCRSQIDATSKLPQIPEGKEGGNEQDRMRDDLGLSSAWLSAATSFAELARVAGHDQQAAEALAVAQAARSAIGGRYWDQAHAFWISGHTDAGKPIVEERSGPGGLIDQHVFTPEQNATLLDKLASADFQADWGTRGVSAAAKTYDPDSYARGSIFALGTAGMASTYWRAHRPVTAEAIWSTMPPLAWLDALGHMHEVLAGDFYHQQAESVPEQTWSSAGFLGATVHGLLGLDVQAAADRVTFAPHLPANWQHLSLQHVRTKNAALDLAIQRAPGAIQFDVTNVGAPVAIVFDPEIPLGARVLAASCNGQRTEMKPERNEQDEHVRVGLMAAQGATHCEIRFQGGVEVVPDPPHALVGDASRGLKITDVSLKDGVLTVAADAFAGATSGFDLMSTERLETADGGRLQPVAHDRYRLTIDPSPGGATGYTRRTIQIRVADTK